MNTLRCNTGFSFPNLFESQPVHKASVKTGAFFMPFVYIVYSAKLNKYYVGAGIELYRRLYEHSIGNSKFTSTGLPWVLKYKEPLETLQEVKRREAAIKKMKSRKYIEGLMG